VSFRRWLGLGDTEPDPVGDTETVRKITAQLDRMEPERARFLAAYAFVLSRVANADMGISDDETRVMERLVAERGSLPEEQAILVVQIAKTQSRMFGGAENFLVTRELAAIATEEQKRALLDCLFAVSSVDGAILTAEDAEISRIASELGLSHGDFVAVKSRYREHLAVLKKDQKDRKDPP
jgi:uncharacterized tellurite resistance protein B-like protein